MLISESITKSLHHIMICFCCLVIAPWNVIISEDNHLDFSSLYYGSSLGVKSSEFITECIEFLDGKLAFKFIKDNNVMPIRIKAYPISIVRSLVCSTRTHYFSKNSTLASVGNSINPIVSTLERRVKREIRMISPCWNFMLFFSFEFFINS